MTMGAHTPERRAQAWLDDASYDLGEAYKLFNAEQILQAARSIVAKASEILS